MTAKLANTCLSVGSNDKTSHAPIAQARDQARDAAAKSQFSYAKTILPRSSKTWTSPLVKLGIEG